MEERNFVWQWIISRWGQSNQSHCRVQGQWHWVLRHLYESNLFIYLFSTWLLHCHRILNPRQFNENLLTWIFVTFYVNFWVFTYAISLEAPESSPLPSTTYSDVASRTNSRPILSIVVCLTDSTRRSHTSVSLSVRLCMSFINFRCCGKVVLCKTSKSEYRLSWLRPTFNSHH